MKCGSFKEQRISGEQLARLHTALCKAEEGLWVLFSAWWDAIGKHYAEQRPGLTYSFKS